MSVPRKLGTDQQDHDRWWRITNEDHERNLEILTSQDLPTESGSDEAHNHPRNEYKCNGNKSKIVIINGLLCSIMRAMIIPRSYPNKEYLLNAILRDLDESEIKEA